MSHTYGTYRTLSYRTIWYDIVHTIHTVPVLGLICPEHRRNVPELYVTLLDKLHPKQKCAQKGGKERRPWYIFYIKPKGLERARCTARPELSMHDQKRPEQSLAMSRTIAPPFKVYF